MRVLNLYREQIAFARGRTLVLLNDIPEADWFRVPKECATHVAWQVGHLAMAEYRLIIERCRGKRHEDAKVISDSFIALFSRGSVPAADPDADPSTHVIRQVFDAVHELVMLEIPKLDESLLDIPCVKDHLFCRTRRDLLMWCSHHEMVHNGQIGLLRRLFGKPTLW